MNSLSNQYRVIVVCTGNICRSPMAELMLAEAFAAAGLTGATVDSAGITAYEAGHPLDPRAARELMGHGIACHAHVAREWDPGWFQTRELILALDVDHYGWLRQAAPDSAARAKVRMLRSFDPAAAGKDLLDQGIEDPWYGGHLEFQTTWELIRDAIPGIVEYVRAQLRQPDRPQQRVRSIS